jgi:hypothetical protein
MDSYELVLEMTVLDRRFTLSEEKYSIISEDFYAVSMTGKLAHDDAHDEKRADFSPHESCGAPAYAAHDGIASRQKAEEGLRWPR